MKMKELLARLHDEGITDISERMVRHYIQKGLIPEPEKPYANQAVYSEEHYKVLKLIGFLKNQSKSWKEIEDELHKSNLIYKDDDEGRLEASRREGYMEELQCMDEWSKIDKEMNFFTKEEIIKHINCSQELFNYIIEKGLIAGKKYYDFSDMHLVRCIHYMKQLFAGEASDSKLIGADFFIKALEKADEITDELVDFTLGYFYSFLFSNLIKSMLFVKAKNKSYFATEDERSVWTWDQTRIGNYKEAKELLESDIYVEDYSFWLDYYEALEKRGLKIQDVFEPVERKEVPSLLR